MTNTSRLRVLMTIGCLDIGGAERRLLQLIQYIQRTDSLIEVFIFVVSGRQGRLDSAFREAGVRIFYGRHSLLGILDFARLAHTLRVDLVHANSESAGGFYCLAARLVGIRNTISHIRSCGPRVKNKISKYSLFYEPFTSLFSNVVLGVSASTSTNRRFSSKNWRVIYNGINPEEFDDAKISCPPEGFTVDGPNFLILGRLDRLKNIAHAISSFANFVASAHYPNARLHVVGPEGNQSIQELRDVATSVGVVDRVLFHGPSDEPLRYFRHADCALLSSDYEGLPGSVLEALACGTPVVASDIGPVREISNLTSGIEVVSVSDKPKWVAAMTKIMSANRIMIESDFWGQSPFSLKRHAEAIISLWFELSGKGLSK